ncbi:MAG: type II toxin-antitoxin system Phd/YefM family antitoxin, partial [Actinobacteria bacterium]|nr:type II toxin-antitoxin system Phd/YefM family antitoxin [Actinomycetota bacterium]
MSTTLPLSEVKNRFSELADQIEREHDRVLVTKNGRPSVGVLSMDELESLEATVEVLSDDAMMAQVR